MICPSCQHWAQANFIFMFRDFPAAAVPPSTRPPPPPPPLGLFPPPPGGNYSKLNCLYICSVNCSTSTWFTYWEKVGMEDPIIYMLHRSLYHWDRGSGAVRIMFLDFPSTQFVQPGTCRSDTGAPQGTNWWGSPALLWARSHKRIHCFWAQHHLQTEEQLQWQAAVSVLLHSETEEIIPPPHHQNFPMRMNKVSIYLLHMRIYEFYESKWEEKVLWEMQLQHQKKQQIQEGNIKIRLLLYSLSVCLSFDPGCCNTLWILSLSLHGWYLQTSNTQIQKSRSFWKTHNMLLLPAA